MKHLEDKQLHKPSPSIMFNYQEPQPLEDKVKREVIDYYLEKQETNIKLSKSFIENIYLEYIIKHKTLAKDEKKEILFHKFFLH